MITVTIISKEGRILAKEVNPMGEKPEHRRGGTKTFYSPVVSARRKKWKEFENKLRTFEIESFICICKRLVKANEHFHCNMGDTCSANLIVGSQYQGEIINETTVRIFNP